MTEKRFSRSIQSCAFLFLSLWKVIGVIWPLKKVQSIVRSGFGAGIDNIRRQSLVELLRTCLGGYLAWMMPLHGWFGICQLWKYCLENRWGLTGSSLHLCTERSLPRVFEGWTFGQLLILHFSRPATALIDPMFDSMYGFSLSYKIDDTILHVVQRTDTLVGPCGVETLYFLSPCSFQLPTRQLKRDESPRKSCSRDWRAMVRRLYLVKHPAVILSF